MAKTPVDYALKFRNEFLVAVMNTKDPDEYTILMRVIAVHMGQLTVIQQLKNIQRKSRREVKS